VTVGSSFPIASKFRDIVDDRTASNGKIQESDVSH
jgi:hypothetical protein